ncbi:hypothetical protein ACP4OV_031871 [Aristida adscensionis]
MSDYLTSGSTMSSCISAISDASYQTSALELNLFGSTISTTTCSPLVGGLLDEEKMANKLGEGPVLVQLELPADEEGSGDSHESAQSGIGRGIDEPSNENGEEDVDHSVDLLISSQPVKKRRIE